MRILAQMGVHPEGSPAYTAQESPRSGLLVRRQFLLSPPAYGKECV